MEPMIEYNCACQRRPLANCQCHLCNHIDELVCSRGRHCVYIDPKPLGWVLGEDDNGYPTGGFTYAWHLQSAPEFPFCEDCASIIERELVDPEIDPAESGIVVEGNDGSLYWSIHVTSVADAQPGRFWAHVTDRTRDGGTTWELESPRSWHTLRAAVQWAESEIERRNQDQLDWEAEYVNQGES